MNWQFPTPLYPQAFLLGLFSSFPLLLMLLGAFVVGSGVKWLLHRGSWYYRWGCHLWALGILEEAQQRFQTAARWSFGPHRAAALARVGLCHLKRGEYAQAVATLEPLMGRTFPSSMKVLWSELPGQLALCLCLQGDTSGARRWLDEGYRRCDGAVTSFVLPEVALLCRQRRYSAALQCLEDWWPMLRFEGHLCSRTRLLREFARWRLWPERYERECSVDWMLLAPFRKEELDFFDAHWPELAFFMFAAQSLSRRYRGRRGLTSATRTTRA